MSTRGMEAKLTPTATTNKRAGKGLGAALVAAALAGIASSAVAQEPQAGDEAWALHGQATFVQQANFAFRSPYRGPNSLGPAARGRETADIRRAAVVGYGGLDQP